LHKKEADILESIYQSRKASGLTAALSAPRLCLKKGKERSVRKTNFTRKKNREKQCQQNWNALLRCPTNIRQAAELCSVVFPAMHACSAQSPAVHKSLDRSTALHPRTPWKIERPSSFQEAVTGFRLRSTLSNSTQYHTHSGIPLGTIPGWWDARKRNKKPLLPIYLRKDISHKLLRSILCLRLSSHNIRVETQRHQGNRCLYELRICNKCDWHTVQDEEHIILDCPSQDLADLRTLFQHLFSSASQNGATRL